MTTQLLHAASCTMGSASEDRACAYLQQQGLVLVTRNYRCRLGELDLIMQDGENLVFVEVRYRRQAWYGGALASVDAHKQRRLIAAAKHYLAYHPTDAPCRFDVIAMDGTGQLQWIQGAFDAHSI